MVTCRDVQTHGLDFAEHSQTQTHTHTHYVLICSGFFLHTVNVHIQNVQTAKIHTSTVINLQLKKTS